MQFRYVLPDRILREFPTLRWLITEHLPGAPGQLNDCGDAPDYEELRRIEEEKSRRIEEEMRREGTWEEPHQYTLAEMEEIRKRFAEAEARRIALIAARKPGYYFLWAVVSAIMLFPPALFYLNYHHVDLESLLKHHLVALLWFIALAFFVSACSTDQLTGVDDEGAGQQTGRAFGIMAAGAVAVVICNLINVWLKASHPTILSGLFDLVMAYVWPFVVGFVLPLFFLHYLTHTIIKREVLGLVGLSGLVWGPALTFIYFVITNTHII